MAEQRLTDEERTILAMVAVGHTDDSMSRHLGVSPRTVRRMVSKTRLLFPVEDAAPCGDLREPDMEDAGVTRPFGLKYAVPSARTIDVDRSKITFDPRRQIAVVRGDDGLVPAMRHTSTQTKTQTGDRSGPNSDTDTTGR